MGRRNLCPNPSLKVNATGWASSSGGWDRVTDVSGLPRTTGWRLVNPDSNGYVQTPTAPATPGAVYTCSLYLRNFSQFGATKSMWVAFTRSAGGDDFSNTTSVSLPDGQVTRASLTATAPANTTGVYIVVDTLNPGISPGVSGWEVGSALYEESAVLGAYADGDSLDWSWDGADGNSASSESDAPPEIVTAGTAFATAAAAASASSSRVTAGILAALASARSVSAGARPTSGTAQALAGAQAARTTARVTSGRATATATAGGFVPPVGPGPMLITRSRPERLSRSSSTPARIVTSTDIAR